MVIKNEDAKAIAGFITRYIKLCDEDAPFEEYDKWRADVRERFKEKPEAVLVKIREILKKIRQFKPEY